MPSPDALRASLDTHEVDRKAGRDRRYVESVLRRIEAPEDAPKASYGEGVKEESKKAAPKTAPAKSSSNEIPAFARVTPIAHPRDKPAEDVVFKDVSKAKKEKRKKGRDESPVVWTDVEEGQDSSRKPDAKAGYMKGNYALFRRQVDGDHAIYFFATELQDDAEQARVPTGYEVRLTDETKLPYIAKRGKAAYLNQTTQVRAKDREQAVEIAARKGIGGIHPE